MANERTVNPYSTEGPADQPGVTWSDYFKRLKAPEDAEEDEEESGKTQTVLKRGTDLGDLDAPPASLKRYVTLLEKNGFQVATGYQISHWDTGYYGPSAQKAGQKKPDQDVIAAWVSGYKPGYGLAKMTFSKVNEQSFTCTYRSINKELRAVSDAEMKAWINDSTPVD